MTRMNQILLTRTAPMIGHLAAYANDITAIIPELYAGLEVVSREMVGFIPAVTRNTEGARAAVGQTINYPISPVPTIEAITSQMTISTPADFTITNGTMTINQGGKVSFGWTGEQQRSVSGSVGYLSTQAKNFAQALRKLVNQMETDVATVAYKAASRATGTSGTTPFGSNFNEMADLRKLLDDNGAPSSGRSLVINSTAGAALRKNAQLTKANEAGSDMTLRDGELLDIHGFSIKESAGVVTHTKGTGASATTNTAGYAIGATTITLASAGTGTIVAGDVITFAGDTNQYVVKTGDADVSGGGTIVLASPGLRQALAASAIAITVTANYAGNLAFSEDAIHLIARAPAVPEGGDARADEYILTDPRSGMQFEVSVWHGERMMKAEVAAVWGIGVPNPAHLAILKG